MTATVPRPPALRRDEYASERDLLADYVRQGYAYSTILQFMKSYHDLPMCLRTLKNKLRHYGITRRKHATPVDTVINAIANEMKSSAANVGYREMHRILKCKHGYTVSKHTVMRLVAGMDPAGSARRRGRRLTRRIYHSEGPNYSWHMDGWDKLKPYGISVHGCIDGFSRRIMWLTACTTNKDSAVVASFYIDCLEEIGCCPKKLWSDAATENVTVAAMQSFVVGTPESHRYVTSVHNQRIEGWWSYLAKARGHWWIDFFRDVCASGIYNPAHHFQKCCMQYCMLPILKNDLQEAASLWNSHRIRPSRSTTCPPGIPNELFFLPANFGAVDHGVAVDRTTTLPGLRDACKRPRYCEDLVVEEYLDHIMSLTAEVRPRTADDGIRLFLTLLRASGAAYSA